MPLNDFYKVIRTLFKVKTLAGCVFLSMFISTNVWSQQINFSKSASWDSLLTVAKASNKLIFLDVYTSWCGPCKLMDREVFTNPAVASKYNANFIPCKLDAEKGNGPELSKKYHVVSYPTYLFVDGNGTLIYRSNGSMSSQDFLVQGKNALAEKKEPMTLLQLDSIYPTKKTDTTFLYTYLQKRTKLKQDNADLLDTYCGLLSPTQQSSIKTLQLIADNGSFMVRNLQIGKALGILLDHESMLPQLINTESIDTYISLAQERTLGKAIRLKDENLLNAVLQLNKRRDLDVFNDESDDMVKLKYFYGTKQYQRYLTTANSYVDQKLMTIPDDTLAKKDKATLDEVAKFMQKKLADKTDQEKQEALASYSHTQTIQLIRCIKTICGNILSINNQKKQTNKCVRWMNRCVYLAELDSNYYRYIYPACLKLDASFLYKAGYKTKAIALQTKAVRLISQKDIAESDEEILAYKKLLNEMKRGNNTLESKPSRDTPVHRSL